LNDPQQINAVSEAILTTLPRGTEPPQIISYNAANVPVAQLNISSDTLSVLQLFDCAFNQFFVSTVISIDNALPLLKGSTWGERGKKSALGPRPQPSECSRGRSDGHLDDGETRPPTGAAPRESHTALGAARREIGDWLRRSKAV
jgi:hypothetical protein